ncbi:efflux RND transporter permease subunit [Zhouia sp. PK063]|uniref:efflux RND transporter permease subunit n=1 Tax=Zhouia sp. PK063 TaxID=3373602 RepID=UPI0037A114A2
MNIPKFFIKHWQFTVCVFLLILFWGVKSFMEMAKTEDPLFPVPIYQVAALYPGAGPDDIEQQVVKPLESALGSLEDVDKIKTKINDGIATIQVSFLQNVDVDKKYDEVIREVNQARADFPDGVTDVQVIQGSTTNVNIVQYALTTEDKSYKELEVFAEQIKSSIESAKGVQEVNIYALPEQQIKITADMHKMQAYQVTLTQVSNAISSEATRIPGGYIDVNSNRYNIKTTGNYEDIATIANTIIKSDDGEQVYLKDIASITEGYEDATYYGRYNGKKAIFITANQLENTNIFDVNDHIEQKIKRYYNSDNGMKLVKIFDQSKSVSHRLNGLYRDFIIAIVLVLFTLLPLGLRASYVVMFTVPTSIFIGITLLYLTGYSLNQFSIVGLVIALGLLVDDSIIVVENIVAKLRKGKSKTEAAIEGTNQLMGAIISVTICILLSFLPLIILDGSTGDFIRSLPMAVIYTMLGSFFVSITLTPVISRYLLKENLGDNKFYRWVMQLNEGPFLTVLHKCLKYPKTTLLIALGLILIGFGLIKVIGVTFFPTAEKPEFYVDITLPKEKNIAATDSVVHDVEAKLKNYPEIVSVASNIGKGNPKIYYNVSQEPQKANFAEIFCEVASYHKDDFNNMLSKMRKEFSQYPRADIEIKEFMQGPPISDPIEIRILGENIDTLQMLSGKVASLMRSTAGTQYVNNPMGEHKTDLKIEVNKDKAAALGVSYAEIAKTIHMAFNGIQVAEIMGTNGIDYNPKIMIQLNPEEVEDFSAFDHIQVASLSGSLVPLKAICDWHFENAPPEIQHYNRSKSVTVTSSTAEGYLTGKVNDQIVKKIAKMKWPKHYQYEVGGVQEKQKESFGGLTTNMFIALFAITAVLILAFHGVKGTLIVASAIPLGMFGAVVALWLFGYSLSFTAFIGLVTLIGLEVKNTIIIVDFTNQMRAAGHSINKAIELAREERFTPIFLTTLTAVFALIPLVIERSDFFSPLALVLIGGLLSSLFLTRFVEPVLYKLLMK